MLGPMSNPKVEGKTVILNLSTFLVTWQTKREDGKRNNTVEFIAAITAVSNFLQKGPVGVGASFYSNKAEATPDFTCSIVFLVPFFITSCWLYSYKQHVFFILFLFISYESPSFAFKPTFPKIIGSSGSCTCFFFFLFTPTHPRIKHQRTLL